MDGAARDLGRPRGVRREHPQRGLRPTNNEVAGTKIGRFHIAHDWLFFPQAFCFFSTPPWVFMRWLQGTDTFSFLVGPRHSVRAVWMDAVFIDRNRRFSAIFKNCKKTVIFEVMKKSFFVMPKPPLKSATQNRPPTRHDRKANPTSPPG